MVDDDENITKSQEGSIRYLTLLWLDATTVRRRKEKVFVDEKKKNFLEKRTTPYYIMKFLKQS